MTRQDYIDWANEYRSQADILEQKIQQRRREIPKKCYYDDKKLKILGDMKNDCLYSMKILLARAERMGEG